MFHSHGPSATEHVHGVADAHSHSHSTPHTTGTTDVAHAILNPHAAWFALASVIIKEWLYRLTARVATEEHSPVLKANALQYVVHFVHII
jgi:divalent metal cation (Fe/Co/Zn/Cd) transporter